MRKPTSLESGQEGNWILDSADDGSNFVVITTSTVTVQYMLLSVSTIHSITTLYVHTQYTVDTVCKCKRKRKRKRKPEKRRSE